MLVVKRKLDDVIRMGDQVRIQIACISRDYVWLTIECPAGMPLFLEEGEGKAVIPVFQQAATQDKE
jgi:sRNA-binding carbon storage regulator CsrA